MKRLWSADELDERWTFAPEDMPLFAGNTDAGKLGLACQLAFWRTLGRFPDDEADLAPTVIAHLAGQIGVPVEAIENYAFTGRSARRHRQAVLDHLAVGSFDEAAEAMSLPLLSTGTRPILPMPPHTSDRSVSPRRTTCCRMYFPWAGDTLPSLAISSGIGQLHCPFGGEGLT